MRTTRVALPVLVGFCVLALTSACTGPAPGPTPIPVLTLAPTLTSTATPTKVPTRIPTPTITLTPTPTPCLVGAMATSVPGVRVVKISNQELAQSLPKKLDQPGVTLKGASLGIHATGIDVIVRVALEGGTVLTATGTLHPRSETGAVLLMPGEMRVEGAPDPMMRELATALLQAMLQDPQLSHMAMPSGRALCVELQEGALWVAELPYTPTPTNTPIPPKALATLFPENPVYALRSLARAGAVITTHTEDVYDMQTGTSALVGVQASISFPTGLGGSFYDLLLRTLEPVLTQGMVLRHKDEGAGTEEYCNCIRDVKLGDLIADICWVAGKGSPAGTYGDIHTRLHVAGARVAKAFYDIEADVNRLRP